MMDRLAAYAEFFQRLQPTDLDRLELLFAADARFKDPFNDVRGVPAVRRVFVHMFETLHDPRFHVYDYALAGQIGYLFWRFDFATAPGRARRSLQGVSRVCFDGAGKVSEHVDYWDPAEQLYARVPVLGALLRMLRRRLSATG